jgi:hypothetical protein
MTANLPLVRKYLLPVSLLLSLFLTHFYFLNRYGINIPFSDDYNEILKKMNVMMDSGSITESASHLFNGHGYSKPITLRLISLLHLSLLHEINFKYLVFTGNMFLLLTCLVVAISTANINKYLMVTAACFIFQPQYWEAIYQATLSNSVFSCLFFSLASMYCATLKSTRYYLLSLMLAVAAQLSFGNGFIVYPMLLMVAFFHKNSRFFTATLIVMALATFLYMRGDTTPYNVGAQIELVPKLKLLIAWLLEFLGSSVGYANGSGYSRDGIGQILSIIIGFLMLLFYLVLIRKKYYAKNILLFAFFTFFILTALMATMLRFTVEAPGESRYQIQSALCILTIIIIIVDLYAIKMNKYLLIMLTVVFPLLYTCTSYRANLSTVYRHKVRLASGLWSWLDHGHGLVVWSDEEAFGRVLTQSNDKKIYRIPSQQTLMTEAWK